MNSARFCWATPNAESEILFIARVSSDQTKTDPGLLGYLIKHGHWSPFEMANMCVEIKTTRAIAQQILRHRSFSFQEFSQRYATATEVVLHVGRKQSERNRQGSAGELDDEVQKEWVELQREALSDAVDAYQRALKLGVAKEQARFLLPLATATTLYMNGTLRSWIHYLDEKNPGARTNDHAQQEHREIAEGIKQIFIAEFPIISQALGWDNIGTHHSQDGASSLQVG